MDFMDFVMIHQNFEGKSYDVLITARAKSSALILSKGMQKMTDEFDPNVPLDEYEFDDPNEELFFAIAWCERPGVAGNFLAKIEKAHSKGADLNGFSKDGETPLTEAIMGGMGTPKVVRMLLQLGADPSKRDKNGWTPWSACITRIDDRVVVDRMKKIKELLLEYNADRSDENLLQLQNAVCERNEPTVLELLKQGVDLNAPIISPLGIAVDKGDLELVKLLLANGASPDGNDIDKEAETPLITAASKGNFEIVKILVEAGAEVERYAWGDKECTADFMAREEGHEEISQWLEQHLPKKTINERKEKIEAMNPKFKEVHEKRTNGINCEITNDDVIKQLTKWDEQFSICVSEIEADRITIHFENLPDELETLANEIYDFCPDVIDQGYGCMDDMIEMAEEHGQEIPSETQKLIEGIDFGDENFGLKILQRDLKDKQMIALWWD